MSRNKKAAVLHTLMTVALAMDTDGILSNEEIDELIDALRGIRGVRIKENMLRKMIIDNGRSLMGVMEVARNLVHDDKDERIFLMQDEREQ